MENEFRSPRTLSYVAMVGVGIASFCQFLHFVFGIATIVSPLKIYVLPSGQRTYIWILMHGMVGSLFVVAYLFSGIIFLVWLFRIYKNLESLRTDPIEFSPGWAVGWWFIPLLNFVKPFQVVRDAWLESDPKVNLEADLFSRIKGGGPNFLTVWWAFWIFGLLLSNVSPRLIDAANTDSFALSGYFYSLQGIVWTAGGILAINVIRDISNRQDERSRNVACLTNPNPPPPPTFGDEGQP